MPPPPPMNMPPMAMPDGPYTTKHDVVLNVNQANGVLANDMDPEGATLTAVLVTAPTSGSLQLNSNGSFVYTPEANTAGTFGFTYKASDGVNFSQNVSVMLTVTNMVAQPLPDSTYVTAINTKLEVDPHGVLENDGGLTQDGQDMEDQDGDTVTARVKTPPLHGALSLAGDGSFTYTPENGYLGIDSFTYWVDDGVVEKPTDMRPQATASIQVVQPIIDIDTDTNNNGAVDAGDDPSPDPASGDPFEEQQPGNIVWLNDDDDDGNGVQDRHQTDWPEPAPTILDDELEQAVLAIMPMGVDMSEDWSVSFIASDNLRLWNNKLREELVTTCDVSNLPDEIFIEGRFTGPGTVEVRLLNPEGAIVHTDLVAVTVVRFELSVNGDDDLTDPGDLTKNYLPGYYLDIRWVSLGETFQEPEYRGQRMKLVLEGLGESAAANIEYIQFNINGGTVTHYAGYANNASDPSIEGAGKTADYSFDLLSDDFDEPGIMLGDRTVVDVYAKDYGGFAPMGLLIQTRRGVGNPSTGMLERAIQVPIDTDGDRLADLWERQEVRDWGWENQFDTTIPVPDLDFYDADYDEELLDPDAAPNTDSGHNMPEHLYYSDRLTAFAEYRGYILDGGGHSGPGMDVHAGGHTRLHPWYKELLVEVDMMEVPPEVPMPSEAQIRSVMDYAAAGMNDLLTGAGIDMYWVLDETAAQPHVLPQDWETLLQWGQLHAHEMLTEVDFHYVAFVDGLDADPTSLVLGKTWDPEELSFVGVTPTKLAADTFSVPFVHALGQVVAHELTHQIIDALGVEGFDGGEHTDDPDPNDPPEGPLDKKYMMYTEHNGNGSPEGLSQIIYSDNVRQKIVLEF